jgi:hypothetical protein
MPRSRGHETKAAFAAVRLRTQIRSRVLGGGGIKTPGSSSGDRAATSREFPQNSENFFSAPCTRHLQSNQPVSATASRHRCRLDSSRAGTSLARRSARRRSAWLYGARKSKPSASRPRLQRRKKSRQMCRGVGEDRKRLEARGRYLEMTTSRMPPSRHSLTDSRVLPGKKSRAGGSRARGRQPGR